MRTHTLYVSATTPTYAPSMAETIAKVLNTLDVEDIQHLLSIEPVYGVWKGERENTVKLTFKDYDSGDRDGLGFGTIWAIAELLALDLSQEAVLWVTDTYVGYWLNEGFGAISQTEVFGGDEYLPDAYTETLEGVRYTYTPGHDEPTDKLYGALVLPTTGNFAPIK